MQLPPITLIDVSSIFAVLAIIFLIAAVVAPLSYGRTSLQVNRRRLRDTAVAIGILFMVTIVAKIISVLFLI